MTSIEKLQIRMERVNALAEVLYDLLQDNHRAQILAEIIMETSATSTATAV